MGTKATKADTPLATTSLSRRKAVQLTAGAGAAALLGTPALAQEGTPGASPSAAPIEIVVPEPVVELPTDEVTFQWMDTGDSKAEFFRAFFPKYTEAHPNITIDYQPLPETELQKLVSIGVQSGNAPDIFQTPPGVTSAQMVAEGWIRALDDVIPDFEAWKAHYPPGVLVEGVTMFNGKTYAFPYLSNRQYSTLCLYDRAAMEATGYDPAEKPLTWDEFRDAARKMTEQGGGQSYGLVIAGKATARWAITVSSLAAMAGAKGGEMDWTTGEYNYTSDQFLAAIDLLLALRDDGSIFPGSLQFSPPEAEARLPQGVARMCLQGPWNIPQWIRNNPDFDFGVAGQPVPNSGEPLPLGMGPGAFIPMWLYSGSKHPEIAADLYSYISSLDGQKAFARLTQGFPPPILPEAQEASADALDPRVIRAYDIFDEQLRLQPSPSVRNPDTAQVSLERKAVTPNFGEVIQGLFAGQLDDPKAAMQDLKDRMDAELERSIEAAREKGAEVSRDDWVFPNWDPTQDYTDEDYAALG
jgi:multiple sugar transport system substrate-binding protein